MRMLKQKSSYLSDNEEESPEQYEASVREAFELERFVGTVELDAPHSDDEDHFGAAAEKVHTKLTLPYVRVVSGATSASSA